MAEVRNPATGEPGDPVETQHGHIEHGAGHEKNDVSISALAKYLGALLAACLIIWLGLLGFWHLLVARIPYEPMSPFSGLREMPPQPRLQVTPEDTLQKYFDEQAERLNSYGPTDGVTKDGTPTYHIPIDKAIDLLAQRGLPSRKQPPKITREWNPNEPSAQ
jgi:hypothetical protein